MQSTIIRRVRGKVKRTLASRFRRRELPIRTEQPLVSFSFDDAPRSALDTGAHILEACDARGTYYLSLGLLGTTSEIGAIARREDVERVLANGHELGCHTFDHCDAYDTTASAYVASVDRNRVELSRWLPGQVFSSFAYPKNGATFGVKPALALRFECCRGGGQTFNAGSADMNLLCACFIDRRAGLDLAAMRALIEANAESRGWLIFAAHDIVDGDGDFSCDPRVLEALVRHSLDAGSRVLPVAAACATLRASAYGPARP